MRSEIGNAAAMREALRKIMGLFRDIDLTEDTPENEAYAIAAYALSAPTRNCDVMDWRTAWAKWRTENHPQKPVRYSECYESTTMFMDWYTGTAERKGESDGK